MPRLFDKHHLAEQQSVRNVPLIGESVNWGVVDIHNDYNLVYMPKDRAFADALGLSPHSGGPIGDYLQGTYRYFELIEQTKTGQAALQGDPVARAQIASRYEQFIDASRLALDQQQLYTNAPLGKTADDIRPITQSFYRNVNQFIKDHPNELAQIRSLQGPELAWSNVVHSEQRVLATLGYMQRSGLPLAAGGDDLARESFAQALASANHGNRHALTESSIDQIKNVLGSDAAAPLRVPYNQRGYATLEALIGQVPQHTLLRAAGPLATGADLTLSLQRAAELDRQDNPRGAQVELEHFAARNVGGWAGGTMAYVAGASTGVIASTAVAATIALDKAVELRNYHGITHRADRQNVEWAFDGRSWTREAAIDKTPDVIDIPTQGTVHAGYQKARELSASANFEASTLALRNVPPPQDPFDLPANSSDRIGPHNPNWQRNPDSAQWERTLNVGTSQDPIIQHQIASPERAAELNQAAVARVLKNVMEGPESIAAIYKEHHLARREGEFVELAPAVQAALPKADVVMGRDGNPYQRSVDGVWSHNGRVAEGNLAAELELTRVVRQPFLDGHQQQVAQLQARPAPTPEQQQFDALMHRYNVARVELKPGDPEAIALATQRTREAHGLSGASAMQLQREKDANGQVIGGQPLRADSPISHYRPGADGTLQLVATTSTEDIRRARQDLAAQDPALPERIANTPAMRGPGMGSKPKDRDEQQETQPDRAISQTQTQGFPADHKDHALFLTLQQHLPKDTPDEKVAEVLKHTRMARIERADQFEKVGFNDTGVYVLGKTWGSHTGTISLSDPAPDIRTSLDQIQGWDKQQTKIMEEF